MRIAVVFFAVMAFACGADATIIHVPVDQSTIQAGINAAATGDTVLVADDHYYARISFLGKAIVVASEYLLDDDTSHILNTIIDADPAILGTADTGSVVHFVSGESAGTRLVGFTITGGAGTIFSLGGTAGGGIYADGSFAEIHNCIVTGNAAFYGGGVFCQHSNELVFEDCEIAGNNAAVSGGGLGVYVDGRLQLTRCVVEGNSAPAGVQNSSGIWGHIHPVLTIENSVLAGGQNMNFGGYDGSIIVFDSCEFTEVNITDLAFGDIWIDNSLMYACSVKQVYSDVFLTNDSLFDSYVGVLDMMSQGCVVRNSTLIRSGIRNHLSIADIDSSYIGDGIYEEGDQYSQIIVKNSVVENGISSAGYSWSNLIQNSIVTGAIDFWNPRPPFKIENSTLAGSYIRIVSLAEDDSLTIINSIVTTEGGPAVIIDGGEWANLALEIECSDFYGFSGAWLGGDATPAVDTSYLYFDDPLFCNPDTNNFHLNESSRCAPANNDCALLIGAKDVGCCCVIRADVDHDGTVLPMDLVYFVDWLWKSGPVPPCLEEADLDGSGTVGPMDLLYFVDYLWVSGPPPVPCS